MSEMVDRVAKALQAKCVERGFPRINEAVVNHLAAAAIEALHDPTDAMIQAGDNVESAVSFVFVAEDVWRAMIAEALK